MSWRKFLRHEIYFIRLASNLFVKRMQCMTSVKVVLFEIKEILLTVWQKSVRVMNMIASYNNGLCNDRIPPYIPTTCLLYLFSIYAHIVLASHTHLEIYLLQTSTAANVRSYKNVSGMKWEYFQFISELDCTVSWSCYIWKRWEWGYCQNRWVDNLQYLTRHRGSVTNPSSEVQMFSYN